jgi:hypothetical protein
MAVASLVLGIVGWVALPVLGALLAVWFGHSARRAIRAQPARFSGQGLTVGGLMLGYAQLVLVAIALLVVLLLVLSAAGLAVLRG